MSNIRIIAERESFGRCIKLFGFMDTDSGRLVAKPCVIEDRTGDAALAEVQPIVHISMTRAQELMDSLWQCGLRPSEGSGSAGALAATERHLRDLQRLVFDKEKQT